MKTSTLVISLATAWLALGVAVPSPVHAQRVVLTPSKQQPGPILCRDAQGNLQADPISVESDALFKPPYNSRDYEMRLLVCPSDHPQGCFNPQGDPNPQFWRPYLGPCSGGSGVPCKWLVRLNQPRQVTVYFKAHIYEKASNRRVTTPKDSQRLDVTWTNTGQRCPEQPKKPGPAVGEDSRAQFAWIRNKDGGFTINVNGRQTPPDPANLTGNFQHWQFTGHDNRNGVHVTCTGGLDPGKRAAPGAPGTMRCEARWGQNVWQCQGQAQMDVDWSVIAGGFGWFAIGPDGCVGTLTEGGNPPEPHHHFGVVWLKSGLGLPLQ